MGKLLWQLLKTAWMTCWAFLDGLVLWLSPSRPAGSRALVVRIDAIGDFVLWSEAGRAIIDFQRAQG
ncbi:MAG TPA: hypothetical protein VFR18_14275, partial [Terriglobia bacterium]|nr:hypothetical protein [Terriglobia bacterium]